MLIVIGVVLLLFIIVPLLIPVPKLDGLVDAKSLADSDSKYIDINGVDIHYKQAGIGDTTYILIHGFGASTFSWREVMPELAKTSRVIAFDRPGFGLTDRPIKWRDFNPYSSESQVELVISLMDKLGVDKAILVGHSAGGLVALNTALKYPKRITKLVLVDAAIYEGGVVGRFLPILNTPQINHLGPLISRVLKNGVDEFVHNTWHNPAKISKSTYDGYYQLFKIKNWDVALWNITKSTYSLKPEKRLSELLMPVLVITGDDDKIIQTKQNHSSTV